MRRKWKSSLSDKTANLPGLCDSKLVPAAAFLNRFQGATRAPQQGGQRYYIAFSAV